LLNTLEQADFGSYGVQQAPSIRVCFSQQKYLDREINHVVWGERTFGAALKRAEKILGVKSEKEV